MNRAWGVLITLAIVGVFGVSAQETGSANKQAPSTPVTEISADRGSCRVDFRVTNFKGEPVYNATIHTQVRWGFMSAHRLDLDAGTNADGRASFIRMPNQVKAPLVFQIRNGSDEALITWDPGTNCLAEYTVPILKKSPQKPGPPSE